MKKQQNRVRVGGAVLVAFLSSACGSDSPSGPTASVPSRSEAVGSAHAANTPPNLRLKTTPQWVSVLGVRTITGVVPFRVHLNLCTSGDADSIYMPDGSLDPRGDSLNWQFNFGDDQTYLPYSIDAGGFPRPDPAVNADGSFRHNFEQFCRVDHVYASTGTFVATMSVTDKHLEDQSRNARISARETTRVTIVVLSDAPPPPPPSSPTGPPDPPNCAIESLSFFDDDGSSVRVTWVTSGSVAAVSLKAPTETLDGLPASGDTITSEGDCTRSFVLTATCGNGAQQQQTARPAWCIG